MNAAIFTTALIVFRESLEAALFVGIVAAATRGVAGRGRWLSGGVGAGIVGAAALALAAGRIGSAFDGLGQDLVNIGVLGLALAMLLWHCIWMAAHARQMSTEARQLGASVRAGQRTPWALFAVIALAVLREGAETVLFVGGTLTAAADTSRAQVAAGALAGLAAGAGLGTVLYAGLARLPARQVFAATNALIALLAASIASQLARALAQAGLIESGTSPLWDSSALLAPDSALGSLLHALAGYDARPSLTQLAAWAAVLMAIWAGTRWRPPAAAH